MAAGILPIYSGRQKLVGHHVPVSITGDSGEVHGLFHRDRAGRATDGHGHFVGDGGQGIWLIQKRSDGV